MRLSLHLVQPLVFALAAYSQIPIPLMTNKIYNLNHCFIIIIVIIVNHPIFYMTRMWLQKIIHISFRGKFLFMTFALIKFMCNIDEKEDLWFVLPNGFVLVVAWPVLLNRDTSSSSMIIWGTFPLACSFSGTGVTVDMTFITNEFFGHMTSTCQL